MFERVLIANRGEIAVRVARTLRRMDVEAVAVFSDADHHAPHLAAADLAMRLGPAPAAESYLNVERVIDAAVRSGSQAIHPGYGFLSERPDFARACQQAGIVFVGPSPEAIALLGDKAAAKRAAMDAGVPVVPGPAEALDDEQIAAWVAADALPVMLKAAAGGGGRGMRVVRELAALPAAIAAARREAGAAFGDDRLIVERFVEHARHIEVQVIADAHGGVLHLGERECSIQRRHQKVIEEAPSPAVSAELRERLGAAAVALARGCGYTGAGTVELVADRDDPARFHFLEMNARLQVEHPVTEAVTGLDLVELQLRVAAGEKLPLTQEQVRMDGHAVEARIYAEDPSNGFLPSSGTIVAYREPAGAIHGGEPPAPGSPDRGRPDGSLRLDSGVTAGFEVSTAYDAMLAKLIAHAPTRTLALRRLAAGLRRTSIVGPTPNIAWLGALLARPEVLRGELDTGLLERLGEQLAAPAEDPGLMAGLAVLALLGEPPCDDPWEARDGWRLADRAAATMRLELGAPGSGELVTGEAVPDGPRDWRVGDALVRPDSAGLRVSDADGRTRTVQVHRSGPAVWLVGRGAPIRCAPARRTAARHAGAGSLQAPMPGLVIDVRAGAGAPVTEGEVLVVMESMKMELSIACPRDGVVQTVRVRTGDRVAQGDPLLELVEIEDRAGHAAAEPAQPAPAGAGPPHTEGR